MGTTHQLSLPVPGSRAWATSGDNICNDELALYRTNFPLFAKAPSERSNHNSVAAQTETLNGILTSLLCTHAVVSIFISYSLFLTKLLAAGSRENIVRKKFSPHMLWCLHFLPQSICYWESLETRCCSVWTSDLMQVDCFPGFKYRSTGFWQDLLGPIWR